MCTFLSTVFMLCLVTNCRKSSNLSRLLSPKNGKTDKTAVIPGVGSKALRPNMPLPIPIMCRSWNFPFYFQTTPASEKPPLLLGISGLQLKGLLVSGGRWGSGGGSWEEVNSPRGYRPMSCFICKAQRWLSLLTASHVHEVDRTTAGSCAFQWLLGKYLYSVLCVIENSIISTPLAS